jgi:chromate reductase
MTKIVIIAGSLRTGSVNRALAAAAAELSPESAEAEVFSLDVIPFYNGDIDHENSRPEGVEAFHTALRSADAVLFVTPEYNHTIPGVLQNAIDWASRPYDNAPLRNKPVGMMGASPGVFGTARAQEHLKLVLLAVGARILPKPGVLVGQSRDMFDSSGVLTDARTRARVERYMNSLVQWSEVLSTEPELA